MKIGLRRVDALYLSKWSVVVNEIALIDCCWVEVNLATLTCCKLCQILNIGVSLLYGCDRCWYIITKDAVFFTYDVQ